MLRKITECHITLWNQGMLCNDTVLVNDPPARTGVEPERLTTWIFTDSHDDHFDPMAVRVLLKNRKNPEPLAVYAFPQLLAQLADAPNCRLHALQPAESLPVGTLECRLTASNHILIRSEAGNALCTFDGTEFSRAERQSLRGIRLDLFVIGAAPAGAALLNDIENMVCDATRIVCWQISAIQSARTSAEGRALEPGFDGMKINLTKYAAADQGISC